MTNKAEDCSHSDHDSEMLKMLVNPKIVFYGPHPCEECGKAICRSDRNSGETVWTFDYPVQEPIYPNTNWVEHKCERNAK